MKLTAIVFLSILISGRLSFSFFLAYGSAFNNVGDSSLSLLKEQLDEMSGQLNKLVLGQEKRNSNASESNSTGSTKLCFTTEVPHIESQQIQIDEEDLSCLVRTSKSIEKIKQLLPDFLLVDTGFKCNVCSVVVAYNFDKGTSFLNSSQPREFLNFKKSLCEHINSAKHVENIKMFRKNAEIEKAQLKIGKEYAINCAGLAYECLYFGSSYISYEHSVANCYSAGGAVGFKNHSKEFPRLFLPTVYNVLRNKISSYITTRELPVGVLADKMTVNHRTRHILGLRVPIWDIRYSNIVTDIYVQSSTVKLHTGVAVTDHLFDSLKASGLSNLYLAKFMSGLAMDGQYTSLNVGTHASKKLDQNVNLSWDPMHRIQLAHDDAGNLVSGNFIEKTVDLITSVTKLFKWGQNYELLLDFLNPGEDEPKILDNFLAPKLFKGMKFVAYSKSVFETFINNFKVYVAASEKLEDEGIRDQLMSHCFVSDLLFLTDVCSQISLGSTQQQLPGLLPWEYPYYLEDLKDHINSMLSNINGVRD